MFSAPSTSAGGSHDAALTRGVDCAMPAVTAPNRRARVGGAHYAQTTFAAVRIRARVNRRVPAQDSPCDPVVHALQAERRIGGNEADPRLTALRRRRRGTRRCFFLPARIASETQIQGDPMAD